MLRVWDLATGETIRTLRGYTESVTDDVNALAVTPDGRYVVSVYRDHRLWVWNLANGGITKSFHGHTGRVTTCSGPRT